MSGESEVTRQLRLMSEGDAAAEDAIFSRLVRELKDMASRQMRRQGRQHTLQTTALVNEVYLRLIGSRKSAFENRGHFLTVAAKAMRSVLVDHARGKMRKKRSPRGDRVPLDRVVAPDGPHVDWICLGEALTRLEAMRPMAARVVELRYFVGLPMREVSEVTGVSLRQAEREWQFARTWLRAELG